MKGTDICSYLLSKGIKPSVQRIAVMEYLMEHKTHPTVDEIYSALNPQIPTLSRTTVYNTLGLLCENGAALMLDIDAKNKRYDGDTSLHAHFMCDQCASVSDVWVDDNRFVGQFAPEGATIRDVQLLYKGICKDCNDKKNNSIITNLKN